MVVYSFAVCAWLCVVVLFVRGCAWLCCLCVVVILYLVRIFVCTANDSWRVKFDYQCVR